MAHTRAQLSLSHSKEVNNFVKDINSDGSTNKYMIENFDGSERVSARSLLGVMYASAEFGDELFLINETKDGYFPYSIDKYRAY